MDYVGLAEAIERLRSELGEAQDAAANKQLRFEVVEVEMELLVELRKEGGSNAKATFGVVSFGADGKVSKGTTHKLKLKLNVRDEALGGRHAEVSGDRSHAWDE